MLRFHYAYYSAAAYLRHIPDTPFAMIHYAAIEAPPRAAFALPATLLPHIAAASHYVTPPPLR